jgi:hypothetical protein
MFVVVALVSGVDIVNVPEMPEDQKSRVVEQQPAVKPPSAPTPNKK